MNNTLMIAVAAVLLVAGLTVCVARARANTSTFRDPDKLAELLASGDTRSYVLVDVRSPEEFAFGHIPGARNIPYDVIASQPPTLDKDGLVILYCRNGNRSSVALRSLRAMGYTNVVDFGAVSRWRGPLVRGSER